MSRVRETHRLNQVHFMHPTVCPPQISKFKPTGWNPWAFCCRHCLTAIILSDPLFLRQIVANRAFREIRLVVDVIEIAGIDSCIDDVGV